MNHADLHMLIHQNFCVTIVILYDCIYLFAKLPAVQYIEKYSCIVDMCIDEGDGQLNEGQRRAIETALIEDNKLLLVQGPPGKLRN